MIKTTAICPVCNNEHVVTEAGKLAAHGWTARDQADGYRSRKCPGSNKAVAATSVKAVEVAKSSTQLSINVGDRFNDGDRKIKVVARESAQQFKVIVDSNDSLRYAKMSLTKLREIAAQ